MALAGNRKLATPHYIVRRSRSGRFNFVLITDAGRLTGFVTTDLDGQPNSEIERQARDKIRALAESFAKATCTAFNAEAEQQIEREER